MKWTEYHEVKALEIYKAIKERVEKDKKFTCSINSFLMKLQNNCFLDTGKGLSSASKLNRKVFNKYF